MNIKHIAIPYDELELFKQEEKYQNYLVQTLIYSTRVNVHSNNNKNKQFLIITKSHLWIEEESMSRKKIKIPLNNIAQIIKSEAHPEIVLSTSEDYDNLRISTSSEERCRNIISALAFYFTYLAVNKRPINVYLIKQNSLFYFQRTSKQKKTGPKFNLQRYANQSIKYVQSHDSPDIFGKMLIQKIILVKQINSQHSHLAHVSKINENQLFICHTLDKDPNIIEYAKNHINLDFVEKLVYARCLQYKTQFFFELLPSLKITHLSLPEIFEQTYLLYDKLKQTKPEAHLSPNLLCISNENPHQIMLRQFRYPQLLFDYERSALIYKKILKENDKREYFINKMYCLGMIIYFYLFGRPLYEMEDIQMCIYLKQHSLEIPFPKYLNVSYSKKLRLFIENCILGKFSEEDQVKKDVWIVKNNIKI